MLKKFHLKNKYVQKGIYKLYFMLKCILSLRMSHHYLSIILLIVVLALISIILGVISIFVILNKKSKKDLISHINDQNNRRAINSVKSTHP